MKKLNILILFFFIVVNLFSQSVNDFRTYDSGEWSDFTGGNSDIWERYDGTSWVVATYFPGQAGFTTNNVTIGSGVTITIDNPATTNNINSITLGDESGAIDTLIIIDDSSLQTLEFTIAYDGFLNWGGGMSGNHTLAFPTGANFVVESPNPDPALLLGTHHGINENFSSCSNTKAIQIGSNNYSTCQGPGSTFSFEQINDNGGNLNVTPTTTPRCKNKEIQLEANPSGTALSDTPLTYNCIFMCI